MLIKKEFPKEFINIRGSISFPFDLYNWKYRFIPMGEGIASVDGQMCLILAEN